MTLAAKNKERDENAMQLLKKHDSENANVLHEVHESDRSSSEERKTPSATSSLGPISPEESKDGIDSQFDAQLRGQNFNSLLSKRAQELRSSSAHRSSKQNI